MFIQTFLQFFSKITPLYPVESLFRAEKADVQTFFTRFKFSSDRLGEPDV